MIVLSDDERRKFSAWLKQDADANDLLCKQLQKLPHAGPIAKRKATEIVACLIVAHMLDSSETQTIGETDG